MKQLNKYETATAEIRKVTADDIINSSSTMTGPDPALSDISWDLT